jgi:hypothetical protein
MAQSPRNGYETNPDQIDWLTTYQDKTHLNFLAASLFVFGMERFKAAKIIEGLPQLEATYRHYKSGIISLQTAAKTFTPFMWDWLIDEIRICLFFENYMKGELLYQGYVIHQFKDSTNDKSSRIGQLIKIQQKQPISTSELLTQEVKADELHRKTINMELMLRTSYQELIRLPSDVLIIVKRMNENRNKLHFASEATGQLGEADIRDLKLLDAFVDLQKTRLVTPNQ